MGWSDTIVIVRKTRWFDLSQLDQRQTRCFQLQNQPTAQCHGPMCAVWAGNCAHLHVSLCIVSMLFCPKSNWFVNFYATTRIHKTPSLVTPDCGKTLRQIHWRKWNLSKLHQDSSFVTKQDHPVESVLPHWWVCTKIDTNWVYKFIIFTNIQTLIGGFTLFHNNWNY